MDNTAAAPTNTAYKGAWGVLILLFLINLFNFIDRTILAVVLEPIRKEYNLTDFDLGMLGTAFTLIYAVMGLPLGRLADTWYRKYVLAGGVTVWSAFTAFSGMVQSYSAFFMVRLGVGVGEASCAPAAISMIGDMFPPEKRGRAMGIFMLGLPLGILLCFIVIAKIYQATGDWRIPFIVAAMPGFLIAIIVLFVREPVRGSQETYATTTEKVDKPFKKVLAIKTIWWISLSGVTVNMAAYGNNTFFKAMLERYYLLDPLAAGKIAAVVLGLSGLLAMTLGALVADWAHKRGINGRLKLGAYSLLVAGPLVLLALLQAPGSDMGRFTLLYASGWVLFYMYYVSVYTAVQDVVEPRLRASAMSIYFAAQYLLGAAFGSLIVGGLSDMFAKQAMMEANATVMTEVFRGIGLHAAILSVPVMLFVTAITMWIASKTYLVDVEKVKHSAAS
jgi:MFS family permease